MADDSSLRIEINLGSPSTVGTHGSENTHMTRSRSRAAAEELRRQQELIPEQPPPLPSQAPLPALTQRIDNTSATQNLNAAIDSANAAPAPQTTLDIANLMSKDGLNALSLAIRNNNTGGMVVTDKQKETYHGHKTIQECKRKRLEMVFEVVIEHCGEALATLASTTITNPDGSEINALIQAIQGEQSPAKKNIINYCMSAYVQHNKMKRNYGHKKKGDHYEPTSMVGQIKAIAQLFDCGSGQNRRGACQYSLFKDFGGPGEYESILQDIWQVEMDKDPHFGKKPFKARFDPLAYEKVQEAIRSGEFDLNNVHDLLLLTIFVQGHKFWLRGCSEQHGRKWSEYSFSLVNNVDKASLDLTKDKTYKPWVIDHLVKVRDRLFIMETAEGDPFKPVDILKRMKKIADGNNIENVLFDKCPKTGEFRKVMVYVNIG